MAKQPDPKPGPANPAKGPAPDPPTGTGRMIAGQDRKASDFRKYNAPVEGRSRASQIWKATIWSILVIAVCWVGYKLIFSSGTGRIGERSTPDSIIETYTNFVRPYIPPSSLSPTQDAVDQWLEYFDEPSRDWFERNVDKISFYARRTEPDLWNQMEHGKRRMEAMKFMLVRGPLKGGDVINQHYDTQADAATLTISTGAASTSEVALIKTGKSWEFQNLMGQTALIEPLLAGTKLPGDRTDPRFLAQSYTTLVYPYAPPSGATLNEQVVDQWLAYFDSGSRNWFDKNVDKLAFLARRDPAGWRKLTSAQRRFVAMQYVLGKGPLRGGAIKEVNVSGESARIVYATGPADLRLNKGNWEFQGLMGQTSTLDAELENVKLP